MILDFHNAFTEPTIAKATRLIVYDNMSNPVAAFIENEEKIITCVTAGDDDFNKVLEQHGISPSAVRKLKLGD